MAMHLVVTSPFGDYAVGDRISQPDEAERWADSPFVIRLAPTPAAAPTEEELQERAEALAALQRLDAKLGTSAAIPEGIARPGEHQQQEG